MIMLQSPSQVNENIVIQNMVFFSELFSSVFIFLKILLLMMDFEERKQPALAKPAFGRVAGPHRLQGPHPASAALRSHRNIPAFLSE